MTEQIANQLKAIAYIDREINAIKTEIAGHSLAQALDRLQADREGRVKSLKEELKESPGVIATPAGHVGFEIRRSFSYSPALIKEKLPDLAPLIIYEAIDNKALDKFTKAAIAVGRYPDALLDELAAAADVKETRAWILDLAELPKEGEAASPEPPKRGRGGKKKAEAIEISIAQETIPEPDLSLDGPTPIDEPQPDDAPAPQEPREPLPKIAADLLILTDKNQSLVIKDMATDRLDEALKALPLPPKTTEPERILYWAMMDEMLRRNPKYKDPFSEDIARHRPNPLADLAEGEIIAAMNSLPAIPEMRSPEQESEYQSLSAEMLRRNPSWQDPLAQEVTVPAAVEPEPVPAMVEDDDLDI